MSLRTKRHTLLIATLLIPHWHHKTSIQNSYFFEVGKLLQSQLSPTQRETPFHFYYDQSAPL